MDPLKILDAKMRQTSGPALVNPFPEIAAVKAAEAKRDAALQRQMDALQAGARTSQVEIKEGLAGLSTQISGVYQLVDTVGERTEQAADGVPENERTPLP